MTVDEARAALHAAYEKHRSENTADDQDAFLAALEAFIDAKVTDASGEEKDAASSGKAPARKK